ncbi:SBBP repeat-containing protein [Hymenobacter sp. IS2118]|uniref:SBBP repeat-containing protein n=1 Tax=Hymenobacter sp. IS2118 TaxID=1505605 RepID=UPI0005506853|nr:SBBP repeat-containing protein [Hymenobacter sp. IS2118]
MNNLYQTRWFKPLAMLALLLAVAGSGRAQIFTQALTVAPGASANSGGSTAHEIATDDSGNSYLVGSFSGTVQFGGSTLSSAGATDIYVAKYSPSGTLLWATRGGGSGDDTGLGIGVDATGNVCIAGTFNGAASFGGTTLTSSGQTDAVVAKVSSVGEWQWAHRAGGVGTDFGQSVAVDGSGNAYFVGAFQSASISTDLGPLTNSAGVNSFALRYSPTGTAVWLRQFTSSSNIYANAVAVDGSGDAYVFGDFAGTAAFEGSSFSSAGAQDLFVTKLAASTGAVVWASRAGGSGNDQAPAGSAIVADASGNSYITGRFSSSNAVFGGTTLVASGSDSYVAKLSAAGTFLWAQRAGGNGTDEGEGVALDGLGNLLATGIFSGSAQFGETALSSAGGFDLYVARYDTATGSAMGALRAGGTGNDYGYGVSSNGTGIAYNTGAYSNGSATFGLTTLSHSSTGQTASFLARSQALTDLVVSTPGQTSSGAYNNVTVTGTGTTTLDAELSVYGTLTVQDDGQLDTNCQPLTGPGNFVLAAGGTLVICDPAGIAATGTTGAVQLTGSRSFSPDANYRYNGTQTQITGPGLPAQVRSLAITNANTVTLSSTLDVTQRVVMGGAGNLDLNGRTLTLLSSAAGTALLVNSGTGQVEGSTGVMQRYIAPSANPGPGYRHYSAPVSGSTVADLAAPGFVPSVNSGYNTSPTPLAFKPFPNVFGYDQTRLGNAATGISTFDKGFFSPAGTADALVVGRGYTVNIDAAALVDFQGTFNQGAILIDGLSRRAPIPAAGPTDKTGWHLVGNPYPAPLDWGTVPAAARPNVDAAAYVYRSSGPYAGSYASFVNGTGAGTGLIAAGQGFFVRASSTATPGSISLTNANRATAYAAQPTFQRPSSTRPLVQLTLQNAASTLADDVFVYAEVGATAAFDGGFDAYKLPNTSGLNVAALAADAEALSVQGLEPLGTADVVVPLQMSVPTAGTYSLRAARLANLPAGTRAVLLDAHTGARIDLATQPSYSFSLSGTAAGSRFSLLLTPGRVLTTASAALGAQVLVYPNPARGAVSVELPASWRPLATSLTLLNPLGQRVRTQARPAGSPATVVFPLADLAPGLYLLRVATSQSSVTKRLTVE